MIIDAAGKRSEQGRFLSKSPGSSKALLASNALPTGILTSEIRVERPIERAIPLRLLSERAASKQRAPIGKRSGPWITISQLKVSRRDRADDPTPEGYQRISAAPLNHVF